MGPQDPGKLGKFGYIAWAFPSAKDPSFKERHGTNKHTLCVILEVDPEVFMRDAEAAASKPHNRGNEHECLKERFAERMLEIVFKHHPELEEHLDHYEVGTPLCNNFFLGKYKGDSYGLEPTPQFFNARSRWLDPRSEINGLYFTGQDVSCDGFAGAIMGGIMCASGIVNPFAMWWGLV